MKTKRNEVRRAEQLPLWKPAVWDLIPFDQKVVCYNGVGADRLDFCCDFVDSSFVCPQFLKRGVK